MLIDEHVTDGKILSTTIIPDIEPVLGAGLGRSACAGWPSWRRCSATRPTAARSSVTGAGLTVGAVGVLPARPVMRRVAGGAAAACRHCRGGASAWCCSRPSSCPAPGVPPFVARVAELGLAGGAAYLLDDAASSSPPSPRRGGGADGLPAWSREGPCWSRHGSGCCSSCAWQDSRPPVLTATVELLVLSLSAMAAAAVLVRRGDPEPGVLVAPAMVLIGLTA